MKRAVEAANAARGKSADVVAITCTGESAHAQTATHADCEANTFAPALSDLDKLLAASEERANEIANNYSSKGKVIFLGSDCDLGTANYAAAKLHEAGGLTSFAAETENLDHGMNFMLEPQDLLVILASTAPAIRRGQTVAAAFSPLCTSHFL